MQSPALLHPLLSGETILWSGASPLEWRFAAPNAKHLNWFLTNLMFFAAGSTRPAISYLKYVNAAFALLLLAIYIDSARPKNSQHFYFITTHRVLIQTRTLLHSLTPAAIAAAQLDHATNSILFPGNFRFQSIPDAPQVHRYLQTRNLPQAA